MIMSQLDQTRTSFPHLSLSMLDTRKSHSRHLIFELNEISRTSCACKTRRVALHACSSLSCVT